MRPARLLLPILIVLLPLLPPETRGESMAGAAVLIALLALLVRSADRDASRALLLAIAVSAAAVVFLYPASASVPLAAAVLAGAAGIHVAALPRAVRWSPFVPASLAAAAALVSLHALSQKLWGLRSLAERVLAMPGIPDREAILARLGEGRAFAAFPTPAALGGFLALALPVTVALALEARQRARIALLGAAALELAGLLCSASATAAAALLGALALAALSRNISRRALVAGGICVLLVIVAIAAMRGSEVLDPDHPGSPWSLRAGNFRAAWAMAVDHPWTGVAPGGFGGALPAYLRPGDNETRYAHDLPLQLAAETGFPAAAFLSMLFLALFLRPVFSRCGEGAPRWLAGARVGLAAFALHNLADFTAFLPSMLWLAALLRGAASEAADEKRAGEPSPGDDLRRGLLAGALAAAAVTALAGFGWNARIEARERLAMGAFDQAVASARRAAALAPWDSEAEIARAQALLARGSAARRDAGDLREALEAADRAVSLDPLRPGARDTRARTRAALGDLPGAYADFSEAARLYPLRADYSRRRDEIAAALPGRAARKGAP